MKRRVAVTGMGLLSPLGPDTRTNWENIRAGRVGIGPLEKVRLPEVDISLAAELKDFRPEEHFDRKAVRRMDPVTAYGLVAAREAFRASGLEENGFDPERSGVIVSSGIGGLGTIEKEHSTGIKSGFNRISPFFIPLSIANMTAGAVAMELGFKGLCSCVVTACAASANGIGEAFHKIRDGYLDLALAGGAEASITELGIAGFAALKALSKTKDPLRASIPFDRERSGFVMGEGAAMLMLEEYEHARARKAPILGEIVGYGASCDAYHMTAPDPSGVQAARCMRMAMEDAGIQADAVGYINAHGTSTPLNDSSETAAIRLAFGEHAHALKISSTKSMSGHMLGASGALEAAVTVLALRERFLPPTAGYREADPECDLDYVPNQGYAWKMDYALSNSLGFGGHNACLAFKRVAEEADEIRI